MTREELRYYVEEQRSLKNIPYYVYSALIDGIDTLEQEPTTKNDLGVDCIDRQAAITFVCKNTKEILKDTMPLEVKLSSDYIYENVAKIMRNPKVLPSVTPIRSKGHWIGSRRVGCGFGEFKEYIVPLKDGFVTDSCHCSECGEWLTGSDEYQCSGNFCPNCGADMREVEE